MAPLTLRETGAQTTPVFCRAPSGVRSLSLDLEEDLEDYEDEVLSEFLGATNDEEERKRELQGLEDDGYLADDEASEGDDSDSDLEVEGKWSLRKPHRHNEQDSQEYAHKAEADGILREINRLNEQLEAEEALSMSDNAEKPDPNLSIEELVDKFFAELADELAVFDRTLPAIIQEELPSRLDRIEEWLGEIPSDFTPPSSPFSSRVSASDIRHFEQHTHPQLYPEAQQNFGIDETGEAFKNPFTQPAPGTPESSEKISPKGEARPIPAPNQARVAPVVQEHNLIDGLTFTPGKEASTGWEVTNSQGESI